MKTKVTGYLTQKHGFYYVVLNLPTDEKGKRNRKTLSTGLSTDRNATKAKALLLTMIREANAGEEVRGVNERVNRKSHKQIRKMKDGIHLGRVCCSRITLNFGCNGNAKAGKKSLIPAIARMSDRGLGRILLNGKYV